MSSLPRELKHDTDNDKSDEAVFAAPMLSHTASVDSLFDLYFKPLSVFAGNFVNDPGAAEDLVQDVFLALIESRKRFESPFHLKSYLYVAVKNKCLKHMRHKEVKSRHGADYRKELEDQAFFHQHAIEEDVFSRLINEINELPPYYRNVYLLVLEGKKNQEIASELGLTLETVKTYKKEGKAILSGRLKDSLLSILVFMGI